MGQMIKAAAIGAVAFMVLDGVWLGLLMKDFYRDQFAPIVRLSHGGIAPNWPSALVVYALLGLVVYGVYDFTNYSTRRQWPFVLTLADAAWGVAASAECAVAVRILLR